MHDDDARAQGVHDGHLARQLAQGGGAADRAAASLDHEGLAAVHAHVRRGTEQVGHGCVWEDAEWTGTRTGASRSARACL